MQISKLFWFKFRVARLDENDRACNKFPLGNIIIFLQAIKKTIKKFNSLQDKKDIRKEKQSFHNSTVIVTLHCYNEGKNTTYE